jgi:hypothetical protein
LACQDVFGFRREERTQHFVRSLRRWVRKVVTEDWSAAELEDEIKELVYEYERHMHASKISGAKEALEIMITGVAELTDDQAAARENCQACRNSQSARDPPKGRIGSTRPRTCVDTRGEAGLSDWSRYLETHLRFSRSSAIRHRDAARALHAVD